MKVDYLNAVVSIDIKMNITFPEGTIEKIKKQIADGDVRLITHYREMIKNQMNMQIHELPKNAYISKCNIEEIKEN